MTGARIRPARAIIYSGGFGHPFAETTPLIAALAEARGWVTETVGTIDEAAARLSPDVGLLIVNALSWTMTQHEKYAPFRDEWAYTLPDEHLAGMRDFVAAGGALLVMHTGTICWDNQPGWLDLMGGGWDWSRSHHPPLGEIAVALTEDGKGYSDGPDRFDLVDEAYHRLDPAPDCTVLAQADAGHGPVPVAWTRQVGQGRVAVDALGHDARSLTAPGHQALLGAMFDWLRGGDA
jgi:type 1 glutamine amidotransferase